MNTRWWEISIQHYFYFIYLFGHATQLTELHSCLRSKESTSQCSRRRRPRFDPWVGRIPWGRKWQPTPVFLPGKSMDRAWWATVHGVAKGWTQLSNWTTRSEWPSSKHLQKIKARKGAEKRECSYTIGRNINEYNHDEEEYRGFLKNYIQNY